MPQIVITIHPDGSTTLETRGFAGASCQQASRFLEDSLGHASQERLTAEYFSAQHAAVETSQQG